MTNNKLLERYISESGLKKQKIAEALNISMATMRKKSVGEREFKASEILKLCEILHISSDGERDKVFFAHSVE